MRYLLFIATFISIQVQGQNGIGCLLFGSSWGEIKLSFYENDSISLSIVEPYGTGISVGHYEDSNGELFYNSGGDLYTFEEPSDFRLAYVGNSDETPICKAPGEEFKFYVFSNDGLGQGNPRAVYSILDLSFPQLDTIQEERILLDSTPYSSFGSELIRIPNTENYWYIVRQKNVGIKRFKIDESGIHEGIVILPYSDEIWDYPYGELDYHNGKIASTSGLTPPFSNEVLLFDFDPSTGLASNLEVLEIERAYGVEFSPDGSKLYNE